MRFHPFTRRQNAPGFQDCLIFGIITGIIGASLWLTAPFKEAEEHYGLPMLYRLRGLRPVPPEVVIINMDHFDHGRLTRDSAVREWPPVDYAHLVEHLTGQQASVIVMDILFPERHTRDDERLARAIRHAGRVILTAKIEVGGDQPPLLRVQRTVMPPPLLESAALGSAPFPLPKRPIMLTRYWRFKTAAGDIPTLPVTAFHFFVEKDLRHLAKASGNDEGVATLRQLLRTPPHKRLHRMRRKLQENPTLAKHLTRLATDQKSPSAERAATLVNLYGGENQAYLNFYGPPGSIPTIPFRQVLHETAVSPTEQTLFTGKAVFIGYCNRDRFDQRDTFYTVYSGADGEDMSGVEVAATAFANLLEDFPVRRFSGTATLPLLFCWGLLLGILCRRSPIPFSVLGTVGLSAAYLSRALIQFKFVGLWYPLVIPLGIQAPFALIATASLKFSSVQRERKRIQHVLGYYLPPPVVSELSKDLTLLKVKDRMVHGICLFSDVAQYSRLSEKLSPDTLNTVMNRYYEAVFKPVRREGGSIIDTRGDTMIAIWGAASPDAAHPSQACRAALDIQRVVSAYNRRLGSVQLPTRIGMYSGNILLGNVGAADFYNFNPIGDVVNTSARLEHLNKILGTRILVSKEIADDARQMIFRDMGHFRLRGKERTVHVMELIGRVEEADQNMLRMITCFETAMEAFTKRKFSDAVTALNTCLKLVPDDGPSLFFKNLAETFAADPPSDEWQGEVNSG